MRKGWEYKKLGEVCDITMGQSPDGNSINETNGVEFHQGKTCFGERFLGVSPLYSNAPTKLAEAHSVLLCVRAPVGYPNITDRKICIGRGLCALYAKREIDNTFLYYSLLGKQSYFEKNATGSTFKAISSKTVSNTTLSIPPKFTQLAIVSELDKINKLIRLKKEQLKDFDNLAQSLFYEMFGDPMENEKGWEVKKLGDISSIGTGSTPNRKNKDFYKNGTYPWVKSTEVCNLPIYSVEEYITEEALKNSNCTLYPPNTILMAMYGQGKTRGQIGLLKIEACTNQAVAAIMPTKEVVDEIFLSQHLMLMYEHIRNMARGGNQANLNLSIVKSIQIFLPPLSLQHLFAQRIEQIEREKSEVQKSIQDLETLLASRMQYWFE